MTARVKGDEAIGARREVTACGLQHDLNSLQASGARSSLSHILEIALEMHQETSAEHSDPVDSDTPGVAGPARRATVPRAASAAIGIAWRYTDRPGARIRIATMLHGA